MAKQKSRSARWADEAATLRTAFDEFKAFVEERREALDTLVSEAKEELKDKIQTLMDKTQDEAAPFISKMDDGFAALKDIQGEYDDWAEQKNEATREKLETLQGIDLDRTVEIETELDLESITAELNIDLDDLENAVGEAETAEMPLGYGRD